MDDEPTNLLMVRLALDRLDYPDCAREQEPRQGSARFRAEKFVLLLIDLKMPGMDGVANGNPRDGRRRSAWETERMARSESRAATHAPTP